MNTYAIKIRAKADADLLKLLDPTGSAMIATTDIKVGSMLIVVPADPSKNKIVTEAEFVSDYADKISASNPLFFKLNKRA